MNDAINRRGRPRTATDTDVFAAIGEIVSAGGPKAVTFGRVAEVVGVTASALAQRFGTKRGLLLAYARQSTSLVDDAFEHQRSLASPVAAIPLALAALCGPVTTRVEMANGLAFLQMDLVDEELRGFAVVQSRMIRRRLAQLVRRAIKAGELQHPQPSELSTLLYAVWSGAMLTWAIDGTGSLQRWVATHVEQALAPYRC